MADGPVKLTRGTASPVENFLSTGSTTLDLPNARSQNSRKSA